MRSFASCQGIPGGQNIESRIVTEIIHVRKAKHPNVEADYMSDDDWFRHLLSYLQGQRGTKGHQS